MIRFLLLAVVLSATAIAAAAEDVDLALDYRENVTAGPGSFVMEVHDFHGFGEAMTRKLVSEIAWR